MNDQGSFGFGGEQRSFSFACFHADRVPNSILAIQCPTVPCEWIMFQNDPDSSDNLFVGSRRLGVVGTGVELEPGKNTGWIPGNNLNIFIHKEVDATTYLNYMLVGCSSDAAMPTAILGFLDQENSDWLLQEDGDRILL